MIGIVGEACTGDNFSYPVGVYAFAVGGNRFVVSVHAFIAILGVNSVSIKIEAICSLINVIIMIFWVIHICSAVVGCTKVADRFACTHTTAVGIFALADHINVCDFICSCITTTVSSGIAQTIT
jgi:hypothetical protein